MKEMDLMFALDAVDDAMLEEADSFTATRRRISWVRFTAIAAMVALLSISVYAIYTETRISYPNDENSWIYQNFEVDGVKYKRVVVEYDLQRVEVKDHAMKFMTDMVDMIHYWSLEGRELFPIGYGATHTFREFEQAENFFGLTFDLPEIVRAGEVGDRDVTLRAVPMYAPEGMTAEEAWEYEPDLGGAKVTYGVSVDDKRIRSVSVTICMGLTEEYTSIPATHGSFMALEVLGQAEIREIRVGDEAFTVVYYPDYPGSGVEAHYVRDGIGYSLDFYPKEDYTGDPIRMIYNHLKDISK